MRSKTFACTEDVSTRSGGPSWNDGPHEGAPKRGTLYVGFHGNKQHRSYLNFDWDFEDIGLLRKAELVVYTSYADYGAPKNPISARVQRVSGAWTEESNHTAWDGPSYINPTVYTATTWYGDISKPSMAESRIDITTLVGRLLPANKQWLDSAGKATAGLDAPKQGLMILAKSQVSYDYGFQLYSKDEDTPALRPFVYIEYDPPNYRPDRVSTISPTGSVPKTDPFVGEFTDPNNDRPAYVRMAVRKVGKTDNVYYGPRVKFDPSWVESGGIWTWTLPALPSSVLKTNVQYEWAAVAWDPSGEASDWSTPWRQFTRTGTGPSLTPVALGSLRTLQGVHLSALWTVESGEDIVSCRLRLRRQGDPWTMALWDESFSPMTDQERAFRYANGTPAPRVYREYGGPALASGTYVWQAQVTDSQGLSAWSAEDTFTLSVGSEVHDDDGTGPPINVTGYARARASVRVVLRDATAAGRGPGKVVGIIENPTNLGIRTVVNAPGEMFFTLPATHPQAGVCEPWQTHYAVQQYRNGAWKDIANGWLNDFDAGENDIVIYGLDYLGALAKTVDPRFPAGVDPDAPHSKGGAKYINEQIGHIITDQLREAKAAPDSTVGFIETENANGANIDSLTTEVSIYSTFKARLDFIRGLIDSNKMGIGLRTRLKPRFSPVVNKWVWDLRNTVGRDRDNLRLEYGSLLQNFRVIALGADFATKAYAIGTRPNHVKPEYASYPTAAGGDFWTDTFGLSQTVSTFVDIADTNDLKRRVKQARAEAAKVGKQVWVAVRVHGIDPFDGYDLMDNIPLDIDRGMVETERYGSGYWTIHGTEWRMYPDGHDELSLIIRPREDDDLPDPDLLPSDPIHESPEWTLGGGPPTSSSSFKPGARYYYDQTSGILYERTNDLDPDVWTAQGLLQGPSGPPGPANGIFSGEWDWTTTTTDADGSGEVGIDAALWNGAGYVQINEQRTDGADVTPYLRKIAAGQQLHLREKADSRIYGLYTVTGPGTDMGTWWRVPVVFAEGSVTMPPNNTDMVVTLMAQSKIVLDPMIPQGLDTTPGYQMVGLSWLRQALADLSHYQVRYAPDAGGAPDTANWTTFATASTSVVINGLTPGVTYWFQVRAVDVDGNTAADTLTPPTMVNANDNPEVGWCAAVSDVPLKVGTDDIAADTIVSNFLKTGQIDASMINTGTLSVGASGQPPEFEVHASDGRLLARWNADGLLLVDTDIAGQAVWLTAGQIKLTTGLIQTGGTPDNPTYDLVNTVWTVGITGDGINAEAITYGTSPGGHNIIPNSGFELTAFATISTKVWTAAADWGSDIAGSRVNMTVTGADLTMTTVTY